MRLLIFFLMLGPAYSVIAQERMTAEESTYTISYAGNNLWNPGADLAFDRIIGNKESAASHRKNTRSFIWRGNAGFYIDPGSHGAVYTQFGLGLRKMKSKSSFTFYLSPVGLYRSFLTESYSVEETDVTRVFLPGNLYVAPSAGVDIGRSLNRGEGDELMVGIQMISLYPYNTYFMPLVNIRMGYRFSAKGGQR